MGEYTLNPMFTKLITGNNIIQNKTKIGTNKNKRNPKRTTRLAAEKTNIKQFVVTNCSKERPGSIVNKTLKNGILMLKDTSKESNFHAGFKYISFIKFSLRHQKLRA